jgi:hypothetical protein
MRIPDDSQHLSIVGANGSGKTQAGLWHLSMRNITSRSWIVINWKKDASIDAIPHAQNLELDQIPIKPGIFIAHPHPEQKNEVEDLMWQVWERENIGVFVDEGYMVPKDSPAFRAILTQGRSKQVPVIVLSQRPVWMDRFVFSEAQFFQIFRLQHSKDRKNVQEFIPKSIEKRLPEYHSYYYDVSNDEVRVLKPVPDIDTIYATFDRKLARVRKTI